MRPKIGNRRLKTDAELEKVWVYYLSLFLPFLVNFAVIIGTGTRFGTDLAKEAKKVHQTTRTVPAKRGTIYDRNGVPIAEDATSYNVYAVIDENYKSATGKILYVEKHNLTRLQRSFISIWTWKNPM